jgi:endoglucanase
VPFGCSKTIYLCDDGKDKEKQEWMKSMGHGYVYVSGRTRAKGETNGKSGNLNNVFAQIYPAELEIPGNECLVIFDADQVGLAFSNQGMDPAKQYLFRHRSS